MGRGESLGSVESRLEKKKKKKKKKGLGRERVEGRWGWIKNFFNNSIVQAIVVVVVVVCVSILGCCSSLLFLAFSLALVN